MSINREWDLLKEGSLWKEAANAVGDPQFQKKCENLVAGLQQEFDRTDWLQFILADIIAASFIRKMRILRYESAHTQIAAFAAKEKVAQADASIRESVRIAAEFPGDDVTDRVIRNECMYDRQVQKYWELAERLWNHIEQELSQSERKLPQPVRRAATGQGREESSTG